RDLWNNKGRTLLVVLSIAVGVLAVGMITTSNTLVVRQMTLAQQASHPSHVSMSLGTLLDDDALSSLAAAVPGVTAVEGVVNGSLRWKPRLEAEWQTAQLIARDDYAHQTFDLIELRTGAWPGDDQVAVEFNHVGPYGVPAIGGTLYFEVNNRERAVTLAGTVRDPGQFPPPFSQAPTFYASRRFIERLVGYGDFNELRFAIQDFDQAKAEAAGAAMKDRLLKQGVRTGVPQIQDPARHPLQDIFDGVGLILWVMAVLSLCLSVFLVVNTINAILAQQVPQIGIMKTIGGLSPEIARMYLSGVMVYCALSLALAVPVGALGGNALAGWMMSLINVPASGFEILRASLLAQLFTGLLTPLLAALYPVVQGVSISVREALSAYGVGSGHYGGNLLDRLLGGIRGMPRLAALALRNTFRRMGRVLLTEVTLVAAGAIFMMVLSTHYSFNRSVEQIFASFGFDVLLGFEQPQRIDKVVPLIESRPGVALAEIWIFRGATLRRLGASGPGSDHDVSLRGIPVDTRLFTPQLTAGRGLDPADGHALLLNQKVARDMGVSVGDTVTMEMEGVGDSDWTVVGLIFDLGGRQNTVFLHRDTLNTELNQTGRGTVAEIKSSTATAAAQAAIEKDMRDFFDTQGIGVSFTDTSIKSQEQANAQFSILTTLLLIMTCLIAVVGSFGLSGTLSINVLERRREIGVMRAVGASSGDVGFIFMGEGLLLGVLSWVLAVPISLAAGPYFVEAIGAAIDFTAVYHTFVPGIFLWLGLVVVLSLLASGLPARRATRISVRESLAYE
ncbi:MAG: FtsX-like permease family protein, partial [Anaerolineales bacterium]